MPTKKTKHNTSFDEMLCQIEGFAAKRKEMEDQLNSLCVFALKHAQQHGDVTLCQQITDAVQDNPQLHQRLRLWFHVMGPIVTRRCGDWFLTETWKKDQFKITKAEVTPATRMIF